MGRRVASMSTAFAPFRARVFVSLLAPFVVLLASGCVFERVWNDAPRIEPTAVVGATLTKELVLAASICHANGVTHEYCCTLTGDFFLHRCDATAPEIVGVGSTVPVPNMNVDRAALPGWLRDADSVELSMSDRKLVVQGHSSGMMMFMIMSDELDIDYSAPSNWIRAAVTLPAVMVDVLTFPIQVAVLIVGGT